MQEKFFSGIIECAKTESYYNRFFPLDSWISSPFSYCYTNVVIFNGVNSGFLPHENQSRNPIVALRSSV
jgi:hypothetical protein